MLVLLFFRKHEVQFTLQKDNNGVAIDDFAIKLEDGQVQFRTMKRHLIDFDFFHQFKLERIDFLKVRIRQAKKHFISCRTVHHVLRQRFLEIRQRINCLQQIGSELTFEDRVAVCQMLLHLIYRVAEVLGNIFDV